MDSFEIPALDTLGTNWIYWHGIVEQATMAEGLSQYLDGRVINPNPQLNALAKFIIISGIPDASILSFQVIDCKTAFDMMSKLEDLFGKPTTTSSSTSVPYETVRVAAQAQNKPLEPQQHDTTSTNPAEWTPCETASLGDNQEVATHHEKVQGQNGRRRRRERRTKCTHQVEVEVGESVEERRVHEHIDDEANSVDMIPTDETGTRETERVHGCKRPRARWKRGRGRGVQ